jgi:capsular exopolysaccharide synthesis family protein
MSRIDEALRRTNAGTELAPPPAVSTTTDTFVSPWSFREHIQPAATPQAEVRVVGRFSSEWTDRLVTASEANHHLVEQFRQLAATLHHAQSNGNIRTVMVASASAGDGKSLTAVNLALTLSGSYARRVLLIDADLRRPSLHEIARVPNGTGLGDTLKAPGHQKLPVYQLSDLLMLVPAGRPDSDPMRALTSPRMQQILQEASGRFDWILIDTPPVGPLADSGLLAPVIDAAILVVRSGKTHYAHVQRAIETIGRDRILGVVLNGTEELENDEYRYYYGAREADASR